MIAAVRGALEHKTLDSALVSVGGVTLRVYCPLSTLSKLDVGETVHLHTYLLVREDALTLYGFSAEVDRATFEQLIGITGVGPRTALALLSTMSTQTLRDAILSEDVTRLTLAPGVGRKLASRLILELRPQMEKLVFGPLLQVPLAMARRPARADRCSKRSPASAIPLQTPPPPCAPCPKTPPAASKT